MPYISASIAIQLLTLAIPHFQKLQKEGESGRRRINQYTRGLTVFITIAQASGYIINLQQTAENAVSPYVNSTLFWFTSIIVLTAGTIFVMWLGERITDKGIGNGISIIIMIGIIAQLPQALVSEFSSRVGDAGGGAIALLMELFFLVVIVVAVIALVQATRRIPVQYAKRIVGNKQYGGVRQYLPLKINAAGVMPIIFAQAIMFIPATLLTFFPSAADASVMGALNDYTSVSYNIIYFVLVIMFTYFYTAIIVNPMQWADDLKKNNGFIPGVNPGKNTAEFIDAVMSRITLPGAIFLGLVAILPAFARLGGVNSQFAVFFGGTSLLIHYDGLMKSGRIKGRQAAAGATY
jgi:preprotein translocase subunit SecY